MKKALLKQVALMVGAALSAGTCFVSCIDDEPVPNRIEIFTEQFSNSRKMTVEHQQVHWVDGDRIYISGTEAELSVSDGHVYASNVAATSPIRALFPTSLTTSAPTSDEVQITLPAEYHYRKTGNLQKLDMPMAAYATGTDAVQFKHLTGALCLMITNDDPFDMTLDKITVTSDNYQLSGSRTVNISSLTSISDTSGTATTTDRSVSIIFDLDSVILQASSTDTLFVIVPVPAVGNNNKFTIEVSTYNIPSGHRYVYHRQQTSGGSLARNQIGYVPVTMITMEHNYTETRPLFSGSGNAISPYLIESLRDFLLFVKAVNTNTNYRDSRFSLTSNIDCAGLILDSPINYNGIMDGQGHSLNNLGVKGRSTSDGDYYCSLFDGIKEVKNLTLNNFTLKLDNGLYDDLFAGCFLSSADSTIIKNCHVNHLAVNTNGQVETTNTYFGNFVGRVRGTTIENCSFSGFENDTIPIKATNIYYGGIIGHLNSSQNTRKVFIASNCTISYNKPLVVIDTATTAFIGGALGVGKTQNTGETVLAISGCLFDINYNVHSNTALVGGVAGSTAKYSRITLDNVTVSGTINATHNGTYFLAGLIGKYYNNNNSSQINGVNTCSYGALSIYENNNQMTDVFPYNN